MSKINEWGIAAQLIELQGQGVTGKPAARSVLPTVQEWARKTGLVCPTVDAIAKAAMRYFEQPAKDGRTRQAHAQRAVTAAKDEHQLSLVEKQVDAIQALEAQFRWVQEKGRQVDTILARLEAIAAEEKRQLATSEIRDAAVVFKAFSSEQRGWLELLVDVKDRLWVHQQYEKAFQEILGAIMAETPDKAPAIADRLRSNPVVANVLRLRAVAGEVA